ncbi:MAG: hypothetical protein KGI25_08010 [Thaumarchaeota archaeon]|nr:hypothetical protein [Nitrososphaerota archaeon]
MRMESLVLLQQLQDVVANSKSIGLQEEDLVKSTFKKILESGDTYSVMDLEDLFVSKANGDSQVIDRIMNIAHYQKSKFDASNKFRMVSDENDCSCGCGGHVTF